VALYTNDSKERVRDAVDMVDLVSSRVELKRAGANRLTGLCPFHDERTPSFGINPAEKVYHCFGCQASGDAFTFVMETEGVDFKGALEHLADRYKVTLELEDEDPQAAEQRKRRERLLELLERTATFYVRQLWESKEAAKAREYLAGRGLREATLREFRVGYAPSAWDTVLNASRRAGFGNRELYDAGLAQRSQSSGRIYDRFRSQIIFPLADARGRVRGFAGRRMVDAPDRPKYVNSPESELFHKGRTLFAADLARGPAAKAQSVVAAEGYTDVIAMHQVGVRNAVAIMGTALTEDQIGELARLAPEVKLALDADSAGKTAMLRAAQIAAKRKPPLRLRVVPLPPGDDPADLVQREGGDAIVRLVDAAVPFGRFLVLRRLEMADLSTADGRDRVLDELYFDFKHVAQPSAEREELERVVASRLDASVDLVKARLARPPAGRPEPAQEPAVGSPAGPRTPQLGRRDPTDRSFLALCIALPELGRPALDELDPDADLTSDVARRAATHLRTHLRSPAHGLDELYDAELVALIRELAVRAAAMTAASRRDFEIERLQLALARVDREIAAARASGAAIEELAGRRGMLRARLDGLMEQV
jgi:DNA primase